MAMKLTSSCEILEYCLEKFKHLENYLENAFLNACEFNNNLEIIKYFLNNKNINLKFTINQHDDYLLRACKNNTNLDIIKYLLTTNENVNYLNEKGENLILMSCLNDNFEILKYLTENLKIEINPVSINRKNAFYYACENNNIKILKYLVEELNYNFTENYNFNPCETYFEIDMFTGQETRINLLEEFEMIIYKKINYSHNRCKELLLKEIEMYHYLLQELRIKKTCEYLLVAQI